MQATLKMLFRKGINQCRKQFKISDTIEFKNNETSKIKVKKIF